MSSFRMCKAAGAAILNRPITVGGAGCRHPANVFRALGCLLQVNCPHGRVQEVMFWTEVKLVVWVTVAFHRL